MSLSPRLERGRVEVWRARTDLSPEALDALRGLLAPAELEQAARFLVPAKRDEFMVGRALLRGLLGAALRTEPRSVHLARGQQGKPFVRETVAGAALELNLAHSGGIVLVAVALGRLVGVDVERVRPDLEHEGLARRFFSSRESARLETLPAEDRTRAFFACWTRKEAFVKATGLGIAGGLDRFDVAFAPGEPAAVLETRPDPAEAVRWTLVDLDLGPDHAAALCYEGRGAEVCVREAGL
ncbi:MAG: 4'-phosphopantetheinyl transferase superfamily protein [Planctomycetes bacterium]|nr:4'-phosphopantetheinyl transferase superfamily protein [Planctomycetota bacterium]